MGGASSAHRPRSKAQWPFTSMAISILLALLVGPGCPIGAGAGDPSMLDRAKVLFKRSAFKYEPELPRQLLDRGRAVVGDDYRLRRFVHKLVTGEPHGRDGRPLASVP